MVRITIRLKQDGRNSQKKNPKPPPSEPCRQRTAPLPKSVEDDEEKKSQEGIFLPKRIVPHQIALHVKRKGEKDEFRRKQYRLHRKEEKVAEGRGRFLLDGKCAKNLKPDEKIKSDHCEITAQHKKSPKGFFFFKKEKQEKRKQEHLAYIQAQTIDDLKSYLATCEFCQDGKKAESELKQKIAAEEKTKAETAANKPSLLETVTQPLLDSAIEVLQDAKNQTETDSKAKAEEAAKAQADAELKKQQEAEAKARVEAEMKAEQEAEAKVERDARAKAEAEARIKSEEKLKSDVENAIKRSTGIDITEIQKMLDANKK
jgi:hypothetical protein